MLSPNLFFNRHKIGWGLHHDRMNPVHALLFHLPQVFVICDALITYLIFNSFGDMLLTFATGKYIERKEDVTLIWRNVGISEEHFFHPMSKKV